MVENNIYNLSLLFFIFPFLIHFHVIKNGNDRSEEFSQATIINNVKPELKKTIT